jgi:hypothetical protein
MASDSRQTGIFIDQVECCKLHIVNGDLIGVAGAVKDIKRFLKWYEQNTNHEELDALPPVEFDDQFEAMVYRDRMLYHYDTALIPVEVGKVSAIGSGSVYAMGLMLGEGSAIDGVESAKKLDPYSGGTVYYVDYEEITNRKTRKPKKAKKRKGKVLP